MRQKWLWCAGLAAAAVIGTLVGAPKIAAWYLVRRAAEMEFRVSLASARLGWGQLVFEEVSVEPVFAPTVLVRPRRVTVEFSASFGVKAVTLEGGSLAIGLPWRELQVARLGWSARHQGALVQDSEAAQPKRPLELSWVGASLHWSAPAGVGSDLALRNCSLRRSLGETVLSAQEVEAELGDASVRLDGARLVVRGAANVPDLSAVGGQVRLLFGAALGASGGLRPGSVGGTAGAQASEDGPASAIAPSLSEGLPSPRSVRQESLNEGGAGMGTQGDKNRSAGAQGLSGKDWSGQLAIGERLEALLLKGTTVARLYVPVGARAVVAGLGIELRIGEEGINLGPARIMVERSELGFSVQLMPDGPQLGTKLRLEGKAASDGSQLEVSAEGGPIALGTIGVRDGDLGLTQVDGASLSVSCRAQMSTTEHRIAFSGHGRVSGVNLYRPKLANGALTGIAAEWELEGDFATNGTEFRLGKGRLQVGAVQAEVSGAFRRTGEQFAMELRGAVPLAACQSFLDAAPQGLLPALSDTRVGGTLAMNSSVHFDSAHPAQVGLSWEMDNQCRVLAVPQTLSPSRFRKAFSYEAPGPGNSTVTVTTGPGTAAWVPIERMSRHLETGVLISEDWGFFRHHGFDENAIKASIRDNLARGGFVRGASTLTMQLAKNLYLQREKTLSRKLQEAILTIMLEQQFTKSELLELYFNVVEFGPGVYGIGPAAQHYFGTTPDRLTLAQSMFLTSILPSPRRVRFDSTGQLDRRWLAYLHKLMGIAKSRGRIDDSEYASGLREELIWGRSETLPNGDDLQKTTDGRSEELRDGSAIEAPFPISDN
jgi:hypothetical protein